jgi:deoxyribodipyrimidine photo-lyase
MWMPELRGVGKKEEGGVSLKENKSDSKHDYSAESLMGVFQAWRMSDEDKERLGLKGVDWVEKPLIKINYSINRRGGGGKQSGGGGGGRGGRGGGRGGKTRGQRGGREARLSMDKVGQHT